MLLGGVAPQCLKASTMYHIQALHKSPYEAPENDSLNWSPDSNATNLFKSKGYRCECCGLVSRPHREFKSGYMEVCQLDGKDYVLCSFCAQSQYIGRTVNGRPNHGLIFYCPELTQGQVSNLAQWAFIAKLRGNQFSEHANRLIGLITRDLIEPVAHVIPGFSSGDVQEFADMYAYMSPKLRARSKTLFSTLKYWPNEVVFEPQVRFWNAAAFRGVTDDLEAVCQEDTSASNVSA